MDTRWSPTLDAWVQVLDRRTLFGRELATVQILGSDRTATVASASLQDARPFDLDAWLATAATARVWKALGSDLLMAPLLSRVLPLPHQFRVLRKAMSRFPVRMLLADEVGMGKTIEAGLVLRELKLRGLVERVLVLAPKSLILQWVAEMDGLFGETFHLVLPGEGWAAGDGNAWQRHAQVVTSLDAVKPKERHRGWSREKLARHNLLRFHDLVGAGWDLVILDESHKVAGTSDDVARYQLASQLAHVTPHLLLLSATPHSGKGDAFRRLVSLLDPDVFDGGVPLDRARVEPYVVRSDKRTATDDTGKALFPQRTTRLVTVPFEDRHQLQARLFDEVTRYVRDQAHAARDRRRAVQLWLVLVQRLASSSTRAVRRYLEARLQILREPPAETVQTDLFDDDDAADEVEAAAAAALPRDALEILEVERLLHLCEQVEATGPDARADALLQHMRELVRADNEPAKKFLVFTEFTATQAMLRELLESRGFAVAWLNGSMDLDQRRAAQEAFRNDAQVLVATDAGGEGLNLQFAHVVCNYDLPWAPMRVEQRIGRVDRIGQARPVLALNFVAENSVEARLYEIWQHKLATILAEFGVDKTGDVLDSRQGEEEFEKLARTALFQPAAFDHELDRVLTEVRRAAQRAQETRVTFEGQVGREDRVPAVPLRAWLDTMARTRQSDLLPDVRTEDVAGIVERLHALRPYAPPTHRAPVLELAGLDFAASGWLSVWKVGLAHGAWQQQDVLALLHADGGAVYAQAGQRIWEALAARRCTLTCTGEVEPDAVGRLQREAEAEAATLFEDLVSRTRALAKRRRMALETSLLRRRDALARLPDDAARRLRLTDLQADAARLSAAVDHRADALPAMDCLLLARVHTR